MEQSKNNFKINVKAKVTIYITLESWFVFDMQQDI